QRLSCLSLVEFRVSGAACGPGDCALRPVRWVIGSRCLLATPIAAHHTTGDAMPTTTDAPATKLAYSPPEVAKLLGLGHPKILQWIRTGELKARNLQTSKSGRPRYSVLHDDLMAFLDSRTVKQPAQKTRRQQSPPDVTPYY